MVFGAAVGLVASFLQLLEKLTLLKDADAVLACNFNSVFSCTNVLNAWQSSVFGFPNSVMCIVFFALVLGIALAGLSSDALGKRLRLSIQGIALFFLCFGIWFLTQSTLVIGALCLFCIFCFTGLLFINGTLLRLNVNDLPIKKSWRKKLQGSFKSGADIFVWIIIALALALMMILKFK